MTKDGIKQHILNVLSILIGLANTFDLKDVYGELTVCKEKIDPISLELALKKEVVHYHTADEE
jgi:hypothetical protein